MYQLKRPLTIFLVLVLSQKYWPLDMRIVSAHENCSKGHKRVKSITQLLEDNESNENS